MGFHPPFTALGSWLKGADQLVRETLWCVFPLPGHSAVYKSVSLCVKSVKLVFEIVSLLYDLVDGSMGRLRVSFAGRAFESL